MAKPTVSNRNTRLTAILKVVMLYLGTFLLLSFIFWNKKEAIKSPVQEQINTYEMELKTLQNVYQKMDTLAKMTNELIEFDKEALKKEGAKAAEIARLEASFEQVKIALFSIQHNDLTQIEKESAETTLFPLLKTYRGEMKRFATTIIDLEDDNADKIDDILDSNEEQYKGEIDGKDAEIEALKKQLEGAEKSGDKSSESSAELEKELADLKEKIGIIRPQIATVQAAMRDLKTNDRVWKPGVRADKINDLKSDIDNLVGLINTL